MENVIYTQYGVSGLRLILASSRDNIRISCYKPHVDPTTNWHQFTNEISKEIIIKNSDTSEQSDSIGSEDENNPSSEKSSAVSQAADYWREFVG